MDLLVLFIENQGARSPQFEERIVGTASSQVQALRMEFEYTQKLPKSSQVIIWKLYPMRGNLINEEGIKEYFSYRDFVSGVLKLYKNEETENL